LFQDELERIVEDIAQSATNEANVSKVEFENNNMDCDNVSSPMFPT